MSGECVGCISHMWVDCVDEAEILTASPGPPLSVGKGMERAGGLQKRSQSSDIIQPINAHAHGKPLVPSV